LPRAGNTSLVRAISLVVQPAIWVANSTWVPFSELAWGIWTVG
jgi:hypothetical protein